MLLRRVLRRHLVRASIETEVPLLLLNGLNKDKEVIAPVFKIRRLGLRPLEPSFCLGKTPS